MDEERKTARGESDAAEQIDGAAASSCGESKTAGDLAGGGEASGAATPSTARSASPLPSPSPTPTFSGHEPAGASRAAFALASGVPASMTRLRCFRSRCLSAVWRDMCPPSPACCTSLRSLRLYLWDLRLRRPTMPRNSASFRPMGLPAMLCPLTNKRLLSRMLFRQRWGLARSVACWGAGSLAAGSPSGAVDASFTKAVEASKTPSSSAASNAGSNSGSSASSGSGRARARLAAGVLARLAAIQRRAAPLQAALRPAGRRKRLRPRVLLKQKKLRSTRCWLII